MNFGNETYHHPYSEAQKQGKHLLTTVDALGNEAQRQIEISE